MSVCVRHFLGDGKGLLEKLVEDQPDGAGRFRRAHRLLHLAEDLRLAQDHRIEPAGHPECMGYRPLSRMEIKMRRDVFHVHPVIVGKPASDRLRLLGVAVDLVRLQVDRIAASFATRLPNKSRSAAVSTSMPKTTRSRTASGAVWWLSPMA
jgi:hypothetical protein